MKKAFLLSLYFTVVFIASGQDRHLVNIDISAGKIFSERSVNKHLSPEVPEGIYNAHTGRVLPSISVSVFPCKGYAGIGASYTHLKASPDLSSTVSDLVWKYPGNDYMVYLAGNGVTADNFSAGPVFNYAIGHFTLQANASIGFTNYTLRTVKIIAKDAGRFFGPALPEGVPVVYYFFATPKYTARMLSESAMVGLRYQNSSRIYLVAEADYLFHFRSDVVRYTYFTEDHPDVVTGAIPISNPSFFYFEAGLGVSLGGKVGS